MKNIKMRYLSMFAIVMSAILVFSTLLTSSERSYAETPIFGDIIFEDFENQSVGQQASTDNGWSNKLEYTKVIEETPGGNKALQIADINSSTLRRTLGNADVSTTLEFMTKFPANNQAAFYVNARTAANQHVNIIHFTFADDGTLSANNGTDYTTVYTDLNADTWYKVTLEISLEDEQSYHLYINGILQAESYRFLGNSGYVYSHLNYMGIQALAGNQIVIDDMMLTTGLVGPSKEIIPPGIGDYEVNMSYKIGERDSAEKLEGGQTVQATATIKNNRDVMDDVMLVVTLYNADGAMIDVVTSSAKVGPNGTVVIKPSAGFKLPDDVTGHVLKAFVWGGTSYASTSMLPLSMVESLQGEGE